MPGWEEGAAVAPAHRRGAVAKAHRAPNLSRPASTASRRPIPRPKPVMASPSRNPNPRPNPLISRRDVIKHLVLSVGGSTLLGACGGRVTLDTLAPTERPLFHTDREMAVLSRVSDLLLPRTETPGALDVQVPAILDRLMTEWAGDETKREHRATLTALDARLGAATGGDFLAASRDQAEEALATVDAAAFDGESLDGYFALKGLIAQAYFSTEGGAVEEQGWVSVPGRWEPCLDRSISEGFGHG